MPRSSNLRKPTDIARNLLMLQTLTGGSKGAYLPEAQFCRITYQNFQRLARPAGVYGDRHSIDYGPFLYTATGAFGPIGLLYDIELQDFAVYSFHPSSLAWAPLYRCNPWQRRRLKTQEQAFLAARDCLVVNPKLANSCRRTWRAFVQQKITDAQKKVFS